ncbi:MAG TPA: DUF916 domain-containing protein [Candidatus Saccharimonadales bacterium]|nr:DUF916 domain-containing protein [Candidatus Saccharimonadales bacterium]
MIRRRLLIVVALVASVLCGVFGEAWQSNVYAAQTAQVGGNALKVSPVRQDIAMDPGTKKTVTVYIQNLTSQPATLHVAINDFMAPNDESGKPNIILDEDKYAPSHSLKRYVRPVPDFPIKANETKPIELTVDVPQGAAGGGYYGAVRFEPVGRAGEENINLSASVGSLILLKVNGNVREELTVKSFDVRQKDKAGSFFTSKNDLKAVVRFNNEGNVHVSPFGKIILKKWGKEVSSQEINNVKPLASILPDSVRRFDVSLDKVGSFGKYTVEGNFGYGSTGQLLTASSTFYVIPLAAMLIGIAALVGLVLLVVIVPKTLKAYNRRIIRKASGRRR